MTECEGPLAAPFKACTACERVWATRDQFLSDPAVVLVGYQTNFKVLELGLFLFDHQRCGTTLSIRPGGFKDLYGGPIHALRLTGGAECPSYCLYEEELRRCACLCECAWVREVMQIILNWPRLGTSNARSLQGPERTQQQFTNSKQLLW